MGEGSLNLGGNGAIKMVIPGRLGGIPREKLI